MEYVVCHQWFNNISEMRARTLWDCFCVDNPYYSQKYSAVGVGSELSICPEKTVYLARTISLSNSDTPISGTIAIVCTGVSCAKICLSSSDLAPEDLLERYPTYQSIFANHKKMRLRFGMNWLSCIGFSSCDDSIISVDRF